MRARVRRSRWSRASPSQTADEVEAALARRSTTRLGRRVAGGAGAVLVLPRAGPRDAVRGARRGRAAPPAPADRRGARGDLRRRPDRARSAARPPLPRGGAAGRDPSKAIDYARRAAAPGDEQLAYEDAADLYARALEVLELARRAPTASPARAAARPRRRRDARRRGWPRRAARLERAAALARELGDAEQLVRAALGHLPAARGRRSTSSCIALLDEALERSGRATARCARSCSAPRAGALLGRPGGRSDELGDEALEIARRIGDPASLALALIRRQFTRLEPGGASRAARRAPTRCSSSAKRLGDRELVVRAHALPARATLELGDIRGGRRELAAYRAPRGRAAPAAAPLARPAAARRCGR